MEDTEKERRRFEVELMKLRLTTDYVKSSLLVIFVCFFVGALFLVSQTYKETVFLVVVVGMMCTILGLILAPRLLSSELDKLTPK